MSDEDVNLFFSTLELTDFMKAEQCDISGADYKPQSDVTGWKKGNSLMIVSCPQIRVHNQ